MAPKSPSFTNERVADDLEHPERFWVDYVMEANSVEDARKLARGLCLEQTVELPDTLSDVKKVEAFTVGSIEQIQVIPDQDHKSKTSSQSLLYRLTVAYPNDTAGDELTQFLNVVFGNTSLKKGVSVENVTLSHHLSDNTKLFPGPRFGIQGLRRLLGVHRAPLLCTALKPMGKSSEEFADMAYRLAKGGIDIIKDDHGLANQVWAPFRERVQLCAQAVQKANHETGRNALYCACLNAPSEELAERAYYSKHVGAGAVMLLPGISGWDVVRQLAADDNFGLPILIHPALLGGWLQSNDDNVDDSNNQLNQEELHHHPHGMSHKFLFGVLPRLCGGDAVIFPNAGGRFQFTHMECQQVAEGCRRPSGRFEAILPSPAGGMKLNRVDGMRKAFGDDTLFLIGGALLEQGPDLEAVAKMFARCAGRDLPHSPPESSKPSAGPTTALYANNQETHPLLTKQDIIPSVAEVERVAMAVRRRVLEYTLGNNGGYLSQACSSAETLATLYMRALNLGPSIASPVPGPFRGSPGPNVSTITGEGHNGDFTDPSLDRLIFSPVHYALILYCLLVEVGRLDLAAFESYNKDGSTLELIGAEHSPGHAVTAGSLAQAISQAAGIAFARKLKGHRGRVVVYMSDGEFQEGQTWEAVQAMVFHEISNLTAVVDVNGQQCDGKMDSVCKIGNLAAKLTAFGAHVHCVDGHDVLKIEKAVRTHSSSSPTFVLCYTDPCRGFPFLRDRAPKLHYVRFKDSDEKAAWEKILEEMDVSERDLKSSDQEIAVARSTQQTKRKLDDADLSPNKRVTTEHDAVTSVTSAIDFCPDISVIEMVSRPHRTNLVEWSRQHPLSITLTADLTSSCEADLLRDTLPKQYISMGMAEQNMMSFAGGLAREGFRPYVQTFGVFVTRRPFDQVAMSIGVPNLPVRLLGFLPGITTPGGVTHQAIDDIALMRSIPNMSILEVADATEVESVLDVAETINGPVYIRMLRGEVPRLFPKTSPMKFGIPRVLSIGSDVAVITAGICTEEGIKARAMIQSSGISIRHVHLSTIVPFPTDIVKSSLSCVKDGVITMENHSIVGGIGSLVAEAMAENGGVRKPLVRLGVHGYAHGASREYLMKEYGIDALSLVGAIEKLVGKKLYFGGESNVSREGSALDKTVLHEDRPEDL